MKVTDPQNAVTTFGYDNEGLLTQKSLPNGVTTSYVYDDLNRLTEVAQNKGSTLLASYAYTLDAAGNRLSVAEADGASIHWTYDDAYRLTSETRKSGGAIVAQSSFTYDPAGNRLSQDLNGVTTNYTYNELDQLLTAGPLRYEYDGRGNLVKATNGGQVTQYTYDALDRQIGASLPDGTDITNTYDADGRRVGQSVDSQATEYLWDEASLYGDVILETGAGTSTSYVLAGAELISQTQNGVASYFLQDGQGSVRALSNGAGAVTDTYSYTAFGELYDQSGATQNKYLYAGQQFDALTGLYSLRARYYDPANGRFLSRDDYPFVIDNPLELNRYGYAAGNPVNYSDPSGQQAFFEYAKIAGMIAIGGGLVGFSLGLLTQRDAEQIDWDLVAKYTLAGLGIGALVGLAWPILVGLSPDSFLDAASLAFDVYTGDWTSFKWDLIGLLIPGVTGLGHLDEAYDALRTINKIDDVSDATRLANAIDNVVDTSRLLNGADNFSDFVIFSKLGDTSSGATTFNRKKLDAIISNLEREGVNVFMGNEAERLLIAEGAEAQYVLRADRPGILVFPNNPSAPAVVEELLHLGQDRNSGWTLYYRSDEELVRLEIEAQEKLLKIGARLRWSPQEMMQTARNLDIWKHKLSTLLGR